MSSTTPVNETQTQFQSQLIRAGAGAGKTTQLIHSFFSFVDFYRKKHDCFPKVVITTFTRKATQEVKERLLKKALSFNDNELFNYINKKSSVHISTIHGLLSLLITRHHDLIQLNAQIKVLDERTLNKIYTKKIQQILKSNTNYLDLLEHYSFKSLVQLLAQFHQMNGYKKYIFVGEEQLLNIRNNKVNLFKNDLEKIIFSESEIVVNKNWSEYFHFLKSMYSLLEQKPYSFQMILNCYESRPSKPRFSQAQPVFDVSLNETISSYFSAGADYFTEVESDQFIKNNSNINELFYKLAIDFDQQIKILKKQTGQISISDLENYSIELAQKFPEIVEKFSNQFHYYMVDEYQDTAPLQVDLLNILMKNKPQFIVGDPQQSIYLFRGARSEVFLNKEAEAQKLGFEMLNLDTNYRSEHKLMHCLNNYVTQLSNQFKPMIPKKAEDGQSSTQAYFIKTENEFKSTIQQIYNLVSQGSRYKDICVLFTKNSDILDFSKFAQQCQIPLQPQISAGFDQKREIKDLVCYLKFLVNPFDQINLITLMRSPWLKMTDQEILNLRQKIDSQSQNFWLQVLESENEDSIFLKECQQIFYSQGVLAALEYFLKKTYFLLYSSYFDLSGLREANIYKLISDLKEKTRQDQFILNEYLSTQFKGFHDDLGTQTNESIPLFSADRVSAMTIHASKGLQFKHVILVGLGGRPKQTQQKSIYFDERQLFFGLPILNSDSNLKWSEWGRQQKEMLNQAELEEYQRLFYVAVTRAEKSISFILENSKSVSRQSWASQIMWPEVGLSQNEFYSIDSQEHNLKEFFNPTDQSNIKQNSFSKDITFDLALALCKSDFNNEKKLKNQNTLSVTHLIQDEGSQNSNEVSLSADQLDFLYKAQKGTELHKLFESLKYANEDSLKNNMSEDEIQLVEWFFKLKEIPFKRMLENGYTEWGFGVSSSKGLLRGQIDLWSIVDNHFYLVDYKTGRSIYKSKAISQLKIYAQALRKMKMINEFHQIKLVVLYPFEGQIVIEDFAYEQIQPLM